MQNYFLIDEIETKKKKRNKTVLKVTMGNTKMHNINQNSSRERNIGKEAKMQQYSEFARAILIASVLLAISCQLGSFIFKKKCERNRWRRRTD